MPDYASSGVAGRSAIEFFAIGMERRNTLNWPFPSERAQYSFGQKSSQ
jgi:hypothetical protein